MGKRSKKKRKLRRLQKLRRMQAAQSQPQLAPAMLSTSPGTDIMPSITLEDSDATPPKSPEASEIKKIALLMTGLATIVVCVAILNAQTPYVLKTGQAIMKFLKIGG